MTVTKADTVYEVVHYWAERTPDAPAIVGVACATLSYRNLKNAVDRIGVQLGALGLGRNDRVAIVHPGGSEMAVVFAGVCSYATAVTLNPNYTVGEFALSLRDFRIKAIAIAEAMETPALAAADRLGLAVLKIAPDRETANGAVSLNGRRQMAPKNPEPAHPNDVAIVLTTSGTTSHSKLAPLLQRQLVGRGRLNAGFLDLTERDRALNMMPLYHGGGLSSGIVTCLYSGSSVCPLPDFSVDTIYRHLEALDPTYLMGAPAIFQSVQSQANRFEELIAKTERRIRMIRTGAGQLDRRFAARLEKIFQAPVIQAYGSSEGGWMACDPLPPASPKSGSVGLSRPNEVGVMNNCGEMLPVGEVGEIVSRGDVVFDGYENDDAANRSAFVDGWFRTGDLGYFDADGYLFITGRIKELINRGGQKVSPNEIDDALLAHPDVVVASAFPVPHPTLGEEVAAAVELKAGKSMEEASLSGFLRERLAAYKLPRRLVFVEAIPKGPTGKVQRHKLAAEFGLAGGVEATAVADDARPATALEAELQALWASSLGREHVGLHDDFFLLGGDSLQAVDLFLRIEKAVRRQLPRSVLFEAGTVAEMAKRIEASSPMRCLVPIQPSGSRPIFFCVHDINGEVLNFRALARHLGEDQPVYGIQSAGLDGAEAPLARMEDMAARYVAEIRQLQPMGPYYLAGYSMGGWIAYEMARQLRAAEEVVGMFALLDTHSHQGRRRVSPSQWLRRHRHRLSELEPSAVAPYLARRFRNVVGLTSTAVRRGLFAAAWRVFEIRRKRMPRFLQRPIAANYLAIRSYSAKPYDGDAVLFRALPYAWDHADAHEGWRTLIGGNLEVRPISGQHHEILEEPHVRDLARELADCLNARQQRYTSETEIVAATG